MGENSSVGVATDYRQGGSGFEPRYGKKFPSNYQTDTGACPASFPGIMRSEHGVHLESRLKEE